MVQDVKCIRTELQILLMPCWEGLEQGHVDLVVAWTIKSILQAAQKANCSSFITDWPLEQNWNAIRVCRTDRVRGIRNCLARQRISNRAGVKVVRFGSNLS